MNREADLDAIMAKVQKLLNVEGRSPEEAAAYVAKAHAILAEHDLKIEDVADLKADTRTSVRKSADVATRTTEGKPDSWKADILEAVARAFECRVLFNYHYEETKTGKLRMVKEGHLVGFGHDVEAAGYANSFLVHEIARLAKDYARGAWDQIKAIEHAYGTTHQQAEKFYTEKYGTHPLRAELSFLRGAAETVSDALIEDARRRRREAADVNPNALVVQKGREVDDEYGRMRANMTPEEWTAYKEEIAAQKAQYAASGIGDMSAYMAARQKEHEAEEAKHAAETPEKHARCLARARRERDRDRRAWERQQRAEENRARKEAARHDQRALAAGREAGASLDIRPGLRRGTGTTKEALR